MKSKDMILAERTSALTALADALKSGSEESTAAAMQTFFGTVRDDIMADAMEAMQRSSADTAALAARDYRPLTSAENAYYTEVIAAAGSEDPKAAFTNIQVAMPPTIVDGVIGTIKKEHPLLDRITFVNTTALTSYILNAAPGKAAKWGALGSKITEELSGAFKKFDVTLLKLTAFMVLSHDFLELGPAWLDRYIRECLSESIALALETGIVAGTGKDEPIGMIKDVSESASVVGGVYPDQTPVKVESLSAEGLGALVKKLARDPLDPTKARVVDDLIFLCNPFDYWGKVMPATCFRRSDGTYVRDLLPIPADIMQSAALAEGKAVLGISKNYFAALGVTGKNGVVTYDDSVHFLEDERVYKSRLQGNGRPIDAYSFLYLDISTMTVTLPVKVLDVTPASP